ncbi:hypothetical protein GCK32_012222 [Trichostrongylus colubriformis]|uniref:Uncharacterized protein n=1 Tax=Trichostrongylus colubriformis TaxID=6319 RepID=A0AAN8EYX3_TRICO
MQSIRQEEGETKREEKGMIEANLFTKGVNSEIKKTLHKELEKSSHSGDVLELSQTQEGNPHALEERSQTHKESGLETELKTSEKKLLQNERDQISDRERQESMVREMGIKGRSAQRSRCSSSENVLASKMKSDDKLSSENVQKALHLVVRRQESIKRLHQKRLQERRKIVEKMVDEQIKAEEKKLLLIEQQEKLEQKKKVEHRKSESRKKPSQKHSTESVKGASTRKKKTSSKEDLLRVRLSKKGKKK